jgi:hypothetical protein
MLELDRISSLAVRRTISFRLITKAVCIGVLGVCAWAQDAQPSLGDAARKARKEHASSAHVPARQTTNEEDGPDAGGVWRVTLCSRTPCFQLSVTLPKSPRWIHPIAEPRPVLLPLAGREDDLNHAIRIYAAESLDPAYASVDLARRSLLQARFARPEYFGQPARLVRDEHVTIDNAIAVLTQFNLASDGIKYRGMSVVAGTTNGNYGFACVYRDEDASTAASICEAIVRSAHSIALMPAQRQVYPSYPTYPQYPRYDDPPEE